MLWIYIEFLLKKGKLLMNNNLFKIMKVVVMYGIREISIEILFIL